MVKSLGTTVKLEQTNLLNVHLTDKKDKNYSSTYSKLLRPELQEMFSISEKVGYAKRSRVGSNSSSESTYLMILTDMGILLLDTSKFEFKAFIPLLGSKLRTSAGYRSETKGGAVFVLEVVLGDGSDKEVLVFSSMGDRQEWITKILKVREKSIGI